MNEQLAFFSLVSGLKYPVMTGLLCCGYGGVFTYLIILILVINWKQKSLNGSLLGLAFHVGGVEADWCVAGKGA